MPDYLRDSPLGASARPHLRHSISHRHQRLSLSASMSPRSYRTPAPSWRLRDAWRRTRPWSSWGRRSTSTHPTANLSPRGSPTCLLSHEHIVHVHLGMLWISLTLTTRFLLTSSSSHRQSPFHSLWVLFQHLIFSFPIFSMASLVLLLM